jgi:hypothetical protein
MNELWVKKTIWRRYLIDDYDLEAAEQTLKHNDNGDEIVADCYDLNEKCEYDLEEVITPIEFKLTNLNSIVK